MVNDIISIEIAKGGFILTYPSSIPTSQDDANVTVIREVFISQRKLNQKLKEVVEMLSMVPAESEEK